ncbi:TonB-dependent receptor [Nisaea sp.]|uniref:TonB-dependent receptor plug domain-containing protein n=1 Tax=Nisaea sp. TaxID=2024842 RepID=UPI003298A0E4
MNNLFKNTALSILLAGTALSTAQAKDIDYLTFQELFNEPVTTGATGTPQRVSDVPLNMTILTAEDLRRSAARNIPEALRRVPGVNVRQTGVNSYNVGIRGYNQTAAERILILVDGRQVYQDYFGLIEWSAIPVAMSEIKQIEVIKGPNTALYGFNATSGVINVITYNPRFDDVTTAQFSGGTGEYIQGDGTATFRNERGGIRFSGSGYSQDQFAPEGNTVNNANGTANDSYYSKAVASYEIMDGVDIGFEANEANSNVLFAGASIVELDNKTSAIKVTAAAESNYGTWDFAAFRNGSDTVFRGPTDTNFHMVTDVFQASNIFKVGANHTFRVMGEYRDVSGNGVGSLRKMSYDITTGSGLWNWQVTDQIQLSNSVRVDYLSLEREDGAPQYDRDMTAVSINSGLVYKPTDYDTVRLTYARAVDLPSFVEWGLSAETDISVVNDVSIGYSHNFEEIDSTVSASLFYQDIEDMQAGPNFSPNAPNPIDSSAFGGELDLSGRFSGGWDWGLGYAYVSTDDTVSPNAPATLTTGYEDRQSEHMLTARLGYAVGDWTFDVYANYMSEYDLPEVSSTAKVDGVLLGSGKINYQVMESMTLSLTGNVGLTGEEPQAVGQNVENSAYASLTVKF